MTNIVAAELTPMQLLEQAIDKGVDPLALEKLMDLQDRHQAKIARKAWNEAVSWFRAKCPDIAKTSSVPDKHGRIKYSFASLDYIQRIIDPLLDEFGLAVLFDSAVIDGVSHAVCRVTHVDGHFEETKFPMDLPDIPGATASMKRGGGATFAKRYALIGALNLPITGEDTNTEPPASITESQAADLRALIDEVAETEGTDPAALLAQVLKYGNVEAIEQFPADKFNRSCRRLRNR